MTATFQDVDLRLQRRRPSHALAEAMGAASTCAYGPCGALPPLWPGLAGALADGAEALAQGLAGAAAHGARSCHLDCPAAHALTDIAVLLAAERAGAAGRRACDAA